MQPFTFPLTIPLESDLPISNVHLVLRYEPFPSASHLTFSSDAVEVRLITIDCYRWNLTNIALESVRAHNLFKVGLLYWSTHVSRFTFYT